MKHRKIILILGSMLLSLSIAGCGKKPEEIPQPTVEPIASEMEVTVQETTESEATAEKIDDEANNEAELIEDAGDNVSDTADMNSEHNEQGEEPEGDTENSEKQEVSLLMVGDILLHTPVAQSGLQEDGQYDFEQIFSHTKSVIEEADIAMVNQEVIIGGEELGISGYPCFNAPYALGDDLVDAGFDVILHATNHAVDKGKRGLENCMQYWESEHPELEVVGIHPTEEDSKEISVLEQNGIKIAILNYTYGTNGIELPSDMPYAVDLMTESKVIEDLQRAEELADFTVVCPHWGIEYQLEENANQRKWATLMAENGADLIIGTHPHVIEPMEWITEDTFVYYSLGNFVNWTSGTGAGVANRMVGGMAQVILERNDEQKVVIKSADVRPVVCHLEPGTNGVSVYFLDEYTEELAQNNAIRGQDSTFSLEYCRELADKVFGNEDTE